MLQRYFLFFVFLCVGTFGYSQVAQVEFGKNRVQYHDFFEEWSQYESENFVTYWYGMSRNVGQSVVQMAEFDFAEIQGVLEHRINEKVQIVVYTDLSDVKQSNIGTEEVFTNTGGQTKIVANTIFVYFDGNHNNLRKQIREGVTQVYLNAMLFGSNIQEIVQNAVLLNLPNWFKTGLIGYIGEPWNTDIDNQLKDILTTGAFENFNDLADEYPALAGHSFWYFISESYGQSIVTNLLYLTRINRSIESGLLYVLGSSFQTIAYDWEQFYRARYKQDASGRDQISGKLIDIKNKKKHRLSQLKMSPDGTKLVYVLNDIGKYRIYLYDLSRDEKKVIQKGGFKNLFQATDYNYPHLAWNPNGQELAIFSERRDKIGLELYNILDGKIQELIEPQQFQRIYSLDYMDPFTILFSAGVSGFGDIFTFHTRTQLSERITNDYYDDLEPTFVELDGEKGILFASNRSNDTLLQNQKLDSILPINTFDIYFYNMDRKIPELVRVTKTPLANERQPIQINDKQFSYLSDRVGVYNREIGHLEDFIHHYDKKYYLNDGTDFTLHADSTLESLDTTLIDSTELIPIIRQRAIKYISTNANKNIVRQSNALKSTRLVEAIQRADDIEIYLKEVNPSESKIPKFTQFQQNRAGQMEQILSLNTSEAPASTRGDFPSETTQIISIGDAPAVPRDTLDPLKFYFQSEFGNPAGDVVEEKSQAVPTELQEPKIQLPSISVLEFLNTGQEQRNFHKFRPANIVPYRLRFRTDYFATQMDNSLLFEGLDNFAANPEGVFGYPPPGILLKANVKDLLEDHVFEGGIRVPTTFNGAEYFVTYTDRKRRLDKNYAVYMKRDRINEGSIGFVPRRKENVILLGQFGVRYPLNIFQSLRARATIRNDRLTQLISDQTSANIPTENATRAGIRLEYVYDNTISRDMNILNGTRIKIFGEVYKKFNLSTSDGFDLNFSDGSLSILSIDARHYQPILKHSIFATRFAANTSFGTERVQYFLGGSDNWLIPQYNNDIPTTGNNYAFQTAAPNIRGFRFGIRNGNSFALINSELRVPIFKYISKNIRSSFFKNFQLLGFFDVGTAWEGNDPYREDNPLNTTVFEEGDVIDVTVNFFRDPIVAGYGFGARTMLFGYFIRADYGWGIETQIVQEPRLHISLGLDF